MNYTGPKVRLSRKLGLSLTPKAVKVMEAKPYPPGQHGPGKLSRRMSNYKRQLIEKQKLRAQFNISERQLRNYYMKANRQNGDTSQNLVTMMARRLDAVVLHGGLAPTIYAARQLVNHGHILVNGQKVDRPGYLVQVNDTVMVKPQSRRLPMFADGLRQAQPPAYLDLHKPDLTVRMVTVPLRDQVPVICEASLVVEYYSK